MKDRLALAVAAVLGVLAGALALATAPATAAVTPPPPAPLCTDWKLRGATGTYPNIVFGGKPAGSEVAKTAVKLVKPTTGVDPGVEFAAYGLEVETDIEMQVIVSYETDGGASTSAGAVRMFAYQAKNADTIQTAPDWQAVASAESGNLVFTIPAGKKIGTIGLVFDASNNTAGSVTFKNMAIGNWKLNFTPCPEPTKSPTPKPTKTVPAEPKSCEAYVYTGTTTNLCAAFPNNPEDVTCTQVKYRVTLKDNAKDPWDLDGLPGGDRGVIGIGCQDNPLKPVATPTPGRTTDAAVEPGTGSAGPSLPVTGVSLPVIAGGGLVLLVIGAGLFLAARTGRRKVNFTA